MRVAIQTQPSNESLPPYNAMVSAESLPEYTLTDLSPPAEAHTRVTHTQAANPAVDYVEAQPHLAFDAEANIARDNAPDVSIADFVICLAYSSINFVVPKVLPGSGRR
jgi:hypothetical protein